MSNVIPLERDVSYRQLSACIETWFDRAGDCPLGMAWPNDADAIARYDVMLNLIPPAAGPVRLLDLGCGTGHLYQHLRTRPDLQVDYHGVDLSSRFIDIAQEKFPEAQFSCGDILQSPNLLQTYDYAVMNGLFTMKCGLQHDQMWSFVQRMLIMVFSRVRCGMAFNAMSKHVDWERDDLFHLPLDTLAGFLCRKLTRHFVLRNDYRLYEFTTYVYHRSSRS
ncbi:MAG: class I SAM-dependent methyltransferase [Planctomycetaceae bacterium]